MTAPRTALEPLLKLNLEAVAELEDSDLVDAGELATSELGKLKRVAGLIEAEIIRRAKAREATRVLSRSTNTLAEIETPSKYIWDADKARAILAPIATPEELAKAIRPAPAPPRPKETVHTQSALALARKGGLAEEIKGAYRTEEAAPSVKYTRSSATVTPFPGSEEDDEVFE